MSTGPFVANLTPQLGDKLRADLAAQDFELSTPPHTRFAAKKKGISVTFYQSGKLVVQGKGMAEFIEFYLEPEILQSFTFGYQQHDEIGDDDLTPHIGIDESGKGDFFGPLCIAGVYGDEKSIRELKACGVRDSKDLTDAAAASLARKIKAICPYHIVRINPLKYNELYDKFRNLNNLLAWGHATTIEQLVEKTQCHNVVVDQFAGEHLVENALSRKKLSVNLTQRHRAEEDLVVAAASILARDAFLEGLQRLGDEVGLKLPKGASAQVKAAAKQLLARQGADIFPKVAKMHFKTYRELF